MGLLGHLPLIRCSLSIWSLSHGRFRVPGLGAHKAQVTRRRKDQEETVLLLRPHLWSHPSLISPHSTDPPRFKEWDSDPHWKLHSKKGTEAGIYIGETIFGKYNQPQLALIQWISQGSWLQSNSNQLWQTYAKNKIVYLKDIENSKTQRKIWKPGLEMSQKQGRLENKSLSRRRIQLAHLSHHHCSDWTVTLLGSQYKHC